MNQLLKKKNRENLPDLRLLSFTIAHLPEDLRNTGEKKAILCSGCINKQKTVDVKFVKHTSLPFNTSTFANRAIKTNLGIPPRPGSEMGFSESLTS